jgi:SPP1 gp7 family putative phage head morphogenesis protein
MDLTLLGKQAVAAKYELQNLTTEVKNKALKAVAKALTDNTEKLLEALNANLVHCVVTGKKTTELKNLLMEQFNVSYRRAEMLVRTELAHIQTTAAAQRYQDYGLTYYEIQGNEDDSCGGKAIDCHKMDGKIFKYSEMRAGVNAPPFHPNCKCGILPVVD